MKKYLIYGVLAAMGLGLGSCTNEQELYFDESSAERLAAKQKEYTELLPEQGGLWAMEYFCNEDEPGYVMTMRFRPDGTVTIGSTNKWNPERAYREATSMWQITADDGPVLSFNTWNDVLHLFCAPNNIPSGEGPTKPATGEDVDETGTGHGGDYEFRLVSISDDGQSLSLRSKRNGYVINMFRLDADTDTKAYCDAQAEASKTMYNTMFNRMALTDTATGERFILSDMTEAWMKGNLGGLINIYPAEGDSISQSIQTNAIMTVDGIRFMRPITVPHAGEDAGFWEFNQKLFIQPDRTFSTADGSVTLTLGNLSTIVLDYSWNVALDGFGGRYADLIEQANAQLKSWNKYQIKSFVLRGKVIRTEQPGQEDVPANKKRYDVTYKLLGDIQCYLSKTKQYTVQIQFDAVPQGDAIVLTKPTSGLNPGDECYGFAANLGSNSYLTKVSALGELCEYMASAPLTFKSPTAMDPQFMDVSTGSDGTFKVQLKTL